MLPLLGLYSLGLLVSPVHPEPWLHTCPRDRLDPHSSLLTSYFYMYPHQLLAFPRVSLALCLLSGLCFPESLILPLLIPPSSLVLCSHICLNASLNV